MDRQSSIIHSVTAQQTIFAHHIGYEAADPFRRIENVTASDVTTWPFVDIDLAPS
jgi:hypothetical protein